MLLDLTLAVTNISKGQEQKQRHSWETESKRDLRTVLATGALGPHPGAGPGSPLVACRWGSPALNQWPAVEDGSAGEP